MLVHDQNFYERHTGKKHNVSITFEYVARRLYVVWVDEELYGYSETEGNAFDKVAEILKTTNWSPVKLT